MNINIRKGEEKDIATVHDLVLELAIHENALEAVITSPEEYLEDFKKGLFQVLVAEMDGEVIGMMLFYITYSTWKGKMMYLDDFVVRASHRRSGIGQLLYDALVKESKNQGARLLKWQVLDWNESAIQFYKKNDAIIEKEWWNVKIMFV